MEGFLRRFFPTDPLPEDPEVFSETYRQLLRGKKCLPFLDNAVNSGQLRPLLPLDAGCDLILKCYMNEDFREGMDAFLTKRPPGFKGKQARNGSQALNWRTIWPRPFGRAPSAPAIAADDAATMPSISGNTAASRPGVHATRSA